METEINIFGKKVEKKKIVDFIKFSAKLGLLLLILVSIFLLCHSVLLSPDDYNYTYVQGSFMQRRVDSIENALETAKYFYNNWTGRVIPHVLIGVFRNLEPVVYEVVNTIVFMVFITTISKVLNKKSTFLSILATFGYLAFSRMFGEKFAWISGSFNYLWPSTFLVLLIYYFYNYFKGEKELKILGKILLILSAFLVGFSHENVAFVGGAFLVCLILFNIKKFFKFEKAKKVVVILTFITFCLGAFATIFAPGNFKRVDQTNTAFSWNFLNNYKENKWVLITVLLSMIAVFVVTNFEKIKNKDFKIKEYNFSLIKEEGLFFVLPALIATLPMAVISYFPPRAFLAYEVLFMIVLAKNVYYLAEHFGKYEKTIAIVSIILTLFVFEKFSPSTLGQINYIIPYKNKVTMQYEEAKAKGQRDVVVSKFEFLQWIHREDGINIDNFFPELIYKMPVNALIAQYYGFDRVTAIADNEYLIEIQVDTEGINKYYVIDIETGEEVQEMEYDNFVRYPIPKDKLGKHKLESEDGKLEDIVLDYKVQYVGGELTKDEVKVEDLIIK